MKNSLSVFIIVLLALNLNAQQFDVDTLLYNGSSNDRINFVILSEGYDSTELNQFIVDAMGIRDDFFSQSPYSNYEKYFNVFAIRVPSQESGASHPGTATDVTEPAHPISSVNNYFGSTFDYFDIHRLLVPTNSTAINTVMANNFPNYDQILILVNTPYYGGSGGTYATTSLHIAANEIAIHEVGHSFVDLIDEYYAGDFYAREGINMTAESDPSLARWSNWSGSNGVSTYQHCCNGNSANWYRPHQNCKMRFLNSPFCPVCKEATIEKIHSLVSSLESYEPVINTLNPTTYPVPFKVNLIKPTPNTLKTEWFANGINFDSNVDSTQLDAFLLNPGNNTIEVLIEDTTQFLRLSNHVHVYSVTWTVNNTTSGFENLHSEYNEFEIKFYPNPANEIINLDWNVTKNGKATIIIRNLEGKELQTKTDLVSELNELNISLLASGLYLIEFSIDGTVLGSRKLYKN